MVEKELTRETQATCEELGTHLRGTYCSKRAARFLDGGQRCSDKFSSQLRIFHLAKKKKKGSGGKYVGGDKRTKTQIIKTCDKLTDMKV